ncbi:MAG: type II toxin-antitoxin system prevent-host-death family antitoxin [Promicromonosporaceae bacterium]|nr:type II toxin-antitoxin system prevent-host-death family antitoxin [Promicromonosporaceae bacterium]
MSATRSSPNVIPQRELRNNSGEILRRAEAGEEFVVTTNGRPVAKVTPIYLAPSAANHRIPARPATRKGGFTMPTHTSGRSIMDILDEIRADRL